jgi:hypothetical protein
MTRNGPVRDRLRLIGVDTAAGLRAGETVVERNGAANIDAPPTTARRR